MLFKILQVFMMLKSDPELQLRDAESAIKSKVIELLNQLEDFKFVRTSILVFIKIESEDRISYIKLPKELDHP